MDGAQALPAGPASQCARRTTLRKPMVPLCPPTPEGDGSNIEEDKSERLQTSFKAFHRASQPGPEAFLSNAVERADDLILSMECEQLLSSADDVMRVAGQPPTSCLRRIPRAVARKSLALACTALAPDLVERDRLRTKAGDLLALLLGNTKTYLEELAPLRSRIRTMDERKFKQATADVCRLEIPAAVYQWDPLLSLPESIQTLAVGVILEKLRCLITQSPLTTIAELTAWSKKMQSRIVELESAKSSTEEELAESRRRLMELDRSLAAQSTRNKELEKECHQAKFLRKQMEAAREEAQRERDRADAVEAELKQMRAKIVNADEARRLEEDLDRQRQSNKKLEQMLVDMRHADAKRQLQARSCAERLCSQNWRRSVEESDARHLSEVMRRGVTDIISSSLEEKDSGTWLQTVTERSRY